MSTQHKGHDKDKGHKISETAARKLRSEDAPKPPKADTAPIAGGGNECGGPNGCGGATDDEAAPAKGRK